MVNVEQFSLLDLRADWSCDWLELEPDLYEFLKPERVVDLERWTFDRRRLEGWAAYLYRDFILPALHPQAACWLCIDAAPSRTGIYINDRWVTHYTNPGADDPPFEWDITACVSPGRNRIGFRVEADLSGRFQGVSVHWTV